MQAHAGARDRAAVVSSVPAFHHACAVGCGVRVAASAGAVAGAARRADPRRHAVSQTGPGFGGRRAAVRVAPTSRHELPSRRHGCAVDRTAQLVCRRRVVSARGVADRRAPGPGADSTQPPVRREVAAGVAHRPPRARGRGNRRGRRRRCGLRQYGGAAHRARSAAAALCRGHRERHYRLSGTPRVCPPARHPGAGRPGQRPRLAPGMRWFTVAELAAALPPSAWRRVTWRNGSNPPLRAQFAALRVTPVVYWRQQAALHEVWLLCERRGPRAPVQRYYFSNLPPTTPVARLARLAHCRWAVEQQYRELKTDLGIDHFEGRTYPGWQHHVVLTALAYRVSATGTPPPAPRRSNVDRAPGPRDRARSVHGADSDYSAPLLCSVGARPSSIFAAPDLTK